ncbi:alpha/beta hydrolase [Nocardia sp. NPDC056000]|uniref:alpha/beta hydrolase n=1 Tax=Nocardia sp. NPDC056000 TaxID=3345674 RepID=UPI0035E00022
MRGLTVRGTRPIRAQRRRSRSSGWLRRSALGLAIAALLPFGVSVAGVQGIEGTAQAAFNPDGFDFWVESSAGMGPIKNRIFRAADGNTSRVVYMLDGERARDDLNGWEVDTNVSRALTAANINVVMPIGGQSSWYADWNAPSTVAGVPAGTGSTTGSGAFDLFNGGPGKSYRYTWETFLTKDLRNALSGRLGFQTTRMGVVGLSMSGSAALTLAAYYPDMFRYAGSFSGLLNLSAPGMREAVRVAMLDAGGYNVDAMAPPWGPQWLRMDPFVSAPRLKANNTRLWIAAASGLPGAGDITGLMSIVQGMPIETIAMINTRSFQVRMASLGYGNVTYDFPILGVHNWKNWENELNRMLPDLSANIG